MPRLEKTFNSIYHHYSVTLLSLSLPPIRPNRERLMILNVMERSACFQVRKVLATNLDSVAHRKQRLHNSDVMLRPNNAVDSSRC